MNSSPETFASFCRRLSDLTSTGSRNWIANLEVDSTSTQARRYVELCRAAGLTPTPSSCFVAWSQTRGRGRHGRSWSSSGGLGLYLTFVLGGLAPEKVAQLPMAVAILIAKLVKRTGIEPRIKWPNDIRVDGRKLAGILLEASSRGGEVVDALVGIGINVHHTRETLPLPTATSLHLEGGAPLDMAELAAELGEGVSSFERSRSPLAEIVAEYRSWSEHAAGDRLHCRSGEEIVEGAFAGFDDRGSLKLDVDGRIVTLPSSEIVES